MDPNTLLSRLPAGFALKPTTEARFLEMLYILPPVAHVAAGFMVGEPSGHRTCGIGGDVRACFITFVGSRDDGGRHHEGTHALTAPEWRALAGSPAALRLAIKRGAA